MKPLPLGLEISSDTPDYIPHHEVSRLESVAATFADSVSNTPLHMVKNLFEHFTASKDDILPADQLNAKYPDVANPFTAPASESLAKSMNERGKRTRMLQQVIEKGPQDFTQKSMNFITGMAPQIVDPINYLSGVAVDAGIARTMGHLLKSGKIAPSTWGRMFDLGLEAPIAKLPTTIVGNVVGNVAQEMTLTQAATRLEQQDFNTAQHFNEAVLGGIVFPLGLKALGKGWDLVKYGRNSVDNSAKVLQAYEQQLADGKVPDVTPMLQQVGQTNLPEMKAELLHIESQSPQFVQGLEQLRADPSVDPEMLLSMEESLKETNSRAEELRSMIKDAEELGAPDRVKTVEDFNNPHQTMIDPTGQDMKDLEEAVTNFVDEDPVKMLQEKLDSHVEELESAATMGLVSPDEVKEFKQYKAEIELHDKLLKSAVACDPNG